MIHIWELIFFKKNITFLPVNTHLLSASKSSTAFVCWAFGFRMACPSSRITLSHLMLCNGLSPLVWNKCFMWIKKHRKVKWYTSCNLVNTNYYSLISTPTRLLWALYTYIIKCPKTYEVLFTPILQMKKLKHQGWEVCCSKDDS